MSSFSYPTGQNKPGTPLATSKCVDLLGYYYINGALRSAGFFEPIDPTDGKGLWLSADYEGHDWVDNPADKKANAAGPKLTKRWADAQLDMAMDKLVDPDSSQNMRALLAGAIKKIGSKNGIGSYIKDALGTVKPFDALGEKGLRKRQL